MHLIEMSRANNIGILMTKLKKTNDEVAHAIADFDESFLTQETLDILLVSIRVLVRVSYALCLSVLFA